MGKICQETNTRSKVVVALGEKKNKKSSIIKNSPFTV